LKESIRNPYPDTSPIDFTRYLIPTRHACGEILYADLEGDYPVFFSRHAVTHKITPTGASHPLLTSRPILSCPRCDYPLDMDWMRPLWLVSPMPYELAARTISRRVCSNCWGQLDMSARDIPVYDDEGNQIMESHRLVLCHDCQYETIGYVTQRWVGYAREQDYLDYGLCLIGLSEALELTEADGLPIRVNQPKQTQAQLLESLGF
jgi:hypothetical protein